jgi:succinate dehydrogenase subunit C
MTTSTLQPPKKSTGYKPFHPRWYRPRVSVYWWLGEWRYLRFILREISSVFVAVFVVETLLLISAVRQGPAAYEHYLACMRNPAIVVLNVVSLFFVVFHTITWFNLAPSAMPVRLGGKRVPDFLVAAPSYLAWVVVSAVVAWLLLH